MRKRLFPLLAVLATSACIGSTEPPAGADITGFYTLRVLGTCNMSILGCPYEGNATFQHVMMSASILLSADLSFEVNLNAQQRTSTTTTDTSIVFGGTYVRNGAVLTMTDTAQVPPSGVTTSQLNLNQITIKSGGITFIYRKS